VPKVREVFERAYGPIPEGATCHVGYPDGHKGGTVRPTYQSPEGEAYAGCADPHKARWYWAYSEGIYGGDISDQPAEAFSPVFQCAAYDAALDALRKEGVDPRNVIALADAWAVAEDEAKEESDYPRVILQRRVNAELAKSRFRTASREFWASLSADGTGESPVLSTHLDVMGEGK
jgi:hypothetical protein